MFHIVLVEPQIPPNTGNVIRLAANTGCTLDLVGPLGFSMEDKLLRRAGLDYHEYATVRVHSDWRNFLVFRGSAPGRMFALTTKGKQNVFETGFSPEDWLVFGSEVQGLSAHIRNDVGAHNCLRLPMLATQRSLNLSNAVAVTVYEAWRQTRFA